MKKLITSMLLCFVLAFSVFSFAACGEKENTNPETNAETEAPTETSETEKKTETSSITVEDARRILEDAIAKFDAKEKAIQNTSFKGSNLQTINVQASNPYSIKNKLTDVNFSDVTEESMIRGLNWAVSQMKPFLDLLSNNYSTGSIYYDTYESVEDHNTYNYEMYFKNSLKSQNCFTVSFFMGCDENQFYKCNSHLEIYQDVDDYEYIVNMFLSLSFEENLTNVFFVRFDKLKNDNDLYSYEVQQVYVDKTMSELLDPNTTIETSDIGEYGESHYYSLMYYGIFDELKEKQIVFGEGNDNDNQKIVDSTNEILTYLDDYSIYENSQNKTKADVLEKMFSEE